jgi:hypothetical protein
MKMEYNVQIERGWPYDGALDRAEVIKSGVTLSNGDWVEKQSDNTVDLTSSTETNAAGLVIRGNGDSGSGAYTGKATVLWGNFIVRAKNLTGGATFVPGGPLTIKSGKLDVAAGGEPVIGVCLDVIGASATQDACIVAKIN